MKEENMELPRWVRLILDNIDPSRRRDEKVVNNNGSTGS